MPQTTIDGSITDFRYPAVIRKKLGITTIIGPPGPMGVPGAAGKNGKDGAPGTFDPTQFNALFTAAFAVAFPVAFAASLSSLVSVIDGNGDSDADSIDGNTTDITLILDGGVI